MNTKLKIILESALMIALATVLSFVKVLEMPFGGSVTLASMLPIAVLSYRRGVPVGLSAGFLSSIIQLLFGLNNLSYAKTPAAAAAIILFDYIIAFTVIGIAGMFRNLNNDLNNRKMALITFLPGIFTAIFLRFLCHWVSGAVVWYELTKEWYKDKPQEIVNIFGPWTYSFVYNIMYMGPELLITLIAGGFLVLFINFRKDNFTYLKK